MIQVLMIEDDVELAQLLQSRLYKDKIEVTIAPSPLEGLTLFQTKQFDLLVLDLSLPQMDGMEICRLIRQESAIPIIISSARSDIRDKMMGYSRGADDYLPKPYDPQELIFRIDAIMRRLHPTLPKKFTPFEVDENRHEITRHGTLLRLTQAEYDIVLYMIKKDRYAISREELLMNIGSIKFESSLKSIDVIMGRIRQKIGDDPKNPHYIVSVRGVGYKFVNE
ncbi:MAG: DNA-binding response regulator [Sulfuricurvum sp. GWF2_44_89]|uniref:DNA-binding response regulator n=1 Tax=Sulfuricurvum kujiense TaxID=148813 RepID=A0A2D3WGT5_9BACT|nr:MULTISPECIES: response regulator transcription factor [Sulfuricurvum]OHD77394.1 MAG: DNA-binding response regulator [Sulfuricurvum sp. GWF2_44_89]OHD90652.1 MAG: DNA-binding response regulator [Sulfuricurvum sp. RIFOXYD12_FULL_44_77]OHD91802.1 MAG: DNA-binding response regulator [Sulfuricurvum sp. RIFOXYD2_FULL_44_160]DAB37496.1 MAG TPA: DNA-binding response regulator [Sulfuricurvum kujiense]